MAVVTSLHERPDLIPTVADRVWNAWWRPRGYPLDVIHRRVVESAGASPGATAFVAHLGPTFVGTASLVASDLFARPEHSPWLAALWVDARFRRRGYGASLVEAVAGYAFGQGVERLYLCAVERRLGFYARLGWVRLEESIGRDGLAVMALDAASRHTGRV